MFKKVTLSFNRLFDYPLRLLVLRLTDNRGSVCICKLAMANCDTARIKVIKSPNEENRRNFTSKQ